MLRSNHTIIGDIIPRPHIRPKNLKVKAYLNMYRRYYYDTFIELNVRMLLGKVLVL